MRPSLFLAFACALLFFAGPGCSIQDPDQPAVGSISVENDKTPTPEKKGRLGKNAGWGKP
ncbi:hypothetical protein [Paludisphaera mucosa]|uniref:Uncharacterized protein n=1 Tax=Paludisphaera mucosa TaxID=3030827 RepID=A0ABT6FIN1_9BACT|nr:hypothetical protein [Paludisphaera mucosa]MDG3007404.1 hypothetical protein [Paludisphaera mucosa]